MVARQVSGDEAPRPPERMRSVPRSTWHSFSNRARNDTMPEAGSQAPHRTRTGAHQPTFEWNLLVALAGAHTPTRATVATSDSSSREPSAAAPRSSAISIANRPGGRLRLAQFRARAFENLVAVAMANYAAPQNDGRSVAFYPDGARIVQAGSAPDVVLANVDLARVRDTRHREAGRDAARRPERYAAISRVRHPRPLAGI